MVRTPLVVALALLGSCASSGYARASATSDKTAAYHEDVVRLADQVGVATATLRALSENPGDSPRSNRETFETYAREVANLRIASKRARKDYGRLDGRADRFFGGWSEDSARITNAELKRSAEERRAALLASYEKLAQSHLETEVALERFILELDDLRVYLEHDLTAAGIASARKTIEKAFTDAAALQERLGALAEDTERASASLAPLQAQAAMRTGDVR
jgi:hypothetical protein